jgi:hypothetical protein
MNPENPEAAQRIVAEYAQLLEQESRSAVYPSSVRSLPYAKPTIKQAIRTCVLALGASRQLTDELRDFLEVAYVSLADYVDDDLVKLLTEFREAAETFAADGRLTREKLTSPAWSTLAGSSRIAGDIARTIAEETEALRQEFRELQA